MLQLFLLNKATNINNRTITQYSYLGKIINKNKIINGNFSGNPQSASSTTVSSSNWNLEMLVFVEGEKPEYPAKIPRSKDENQQQTIYSCQRLDAVFP